jgi:Fe-S cluster assembly scaffold protein SufB
VFTDGSFVYIPKGVRCPMELSTYFRINAANTGQFERTLIIADKGATSAIWKAAPRRSAMKTSCTPPWSNWWRWKTRPSSTPRCRTGIPAMPKAGRHL